MKHDPKRSQLRSEFQGSICRSRQSNARDLKIEIHEVVPSLWLQKKSDQEIRMFYDVARGGGSKGLGFFKIALKSWIVL